MNNLNCKTQAHAKVCEENKLGEKTTSYPLKDIFIERSAIRYTKEMDLSVLTCDDAS